MKRFDKDGLTARLAGLAPHARVVFAACCATRLRGAYQKFCDETHLGRPDVVDRALALVWQWTQGDQRRLAEHKECLDQLKELIPDDNDPAWSRLNPALQPFLGYADDAVCAAAYALRTALSASPQDAAWAAGRACEVLEHHLVNFCTLDAARAAPSLFGHRLMQAELARQERDLRELSALEPPAISSRAEQFRQRAESEETIPIKR